MSGSVWEPDEEDKDYEETNPFESYWMEGDSLAPPCQADISTVDFLLDLVSPSSSDYVLDLGCGDGRIPLRASSRFGCFGAGVEW